MELAQGGLVFSGSDSVTQVDFGVVSCKGHEAGQATGLSGNEPGNSRNNTATALQYLQGVLEMLIHVAL